jgi:hypothetical protein
MTPRAKSDWFRTTFDSKASPETAGVLARTDVKIAASGVATRACHTLPDLNQNEASAVVHDLRRDGRIAVPPLMATASAELNLARSRQSWRASERIGEPNVKIPTESYRHV